GEPADGPLAGVVRRTYRPHVVLAGAPKPRERGAGDGVPLDRAAGDGGDGVPLLAHRGRLEGAATAYVCERFACQAPVSDPAALGALLGDAAG
ncbi:MAG TPA: hypothetical protein VFN48_10885, partial [Solirubrobacteraceae bacterium]|nr:hypothetical protein [Solirubrobacteraceae bacterium]